MDQIDGKVFFLIATAVVAVVGSVKRAWPTWTKGKEEFLSIILPMVFVVAAKLLGAFKGTDWTDALIWAFASGPLAGVLHDKALNPVLKFTNRFRGGSEPEVKP